MNLFLIQITEERMSKRDHPVILIDGHSVNVYFLQATSATQAAYPHEVIPPARPLSSLITAPPVTA